MKNSFYFLFTLIFLSCSSPTENEIKEPESPVDVDVESTFDNCFSAPDSKFQQTVVGCSGGSYKLINDQYVLRIYSDQVTEYGDCQFLTNDSLSQNFNATLIMFNKGQASLANICTDMVSRMRLRL